MIKVACAAAALVLTGMSLASAQDVQVWVGGEADMDACGSSAEVIAGGATVYSGPGHDYAAMDVIPGGTHLHVCDSSPDDVWHGVVGPTDFGCGVGSPIAQRQPYNGPCNSGWVEHRFLTNWAG